MDNRRSMVVAAFSTIVEWYDFTLYLYLAPVLARVFFGGEKNATLATLAVFAVSYVMRPVGAAVFGHYGDRIGRRRVLLVSMTIMALAMLVTALLPTYAEVGALAGVLMFLVRCVMGFSVGGEYSGVLVFLVESVRPRRRGFVASLASAASEVGALLAAGISALVVWWLPQASVDSWGWRIPFFFGAALAFGTLVMRSSMEETPVFAEARAKGELPKNPLKDVVGKQRKALLRTFAISALGSVTYYVGVTYVPTYLTSVGGFSDSAALTVSTIAAVVVIAVTPLVGLLSDRIGRRPTLIGLTVFFVLVPLSMFAFMAAGTTFHAVTGALVLGAGAGAFSAAAAATVPEQFATAGRLSGLALGYTLATAAFGGLAPYVAEQMISLTGWELFPGLLVLLVAVAILPILWKLPETARRDLGSPGRTADQPLEAA
ncbi:MFS transporter [Actinocorallia longicatena]|uniref:MFS transporter n=1 Tax=Actinocorallia longicatena TaxID=111803 RepID=A0ABP6QDK8_9ACTN